MLAALISHIAALIIDKHSFYDQLKKGYIEEEMKAEQSQKPVEME
jgi:hypothetical protein